MLALAGKGSETTIIKVFNNSKENIRHNDQIDGESQQKRKGYQKRRINGYSRTETYNKFQISLNGLNSVLDSAGEKN